MSAPQEADEVRERFQELSARWHDETGGMSNPHQIMANPNAQAILEMGEAALPFIFEEMADHRGFWFPILHRITGEWPCPESEAGNVPRMTARWLYWWAQRQIANRDAFERAVEAREKLVAGWGRGPEADALAESLRMAAEARKQEVRAEAAEARLSRLEAALEEIATVCALDGEPDSNDAANTAVDIARAALKAGEGEANG